MKPVLNLLISYHSDVMRTPSVNDFNGLISGGLSGTYDVKLQVKEFREVTGSEPCDVFYFCYRMGERVDFLTIEAELEHRLTVVAF